MEHADRRDCDHARADDDGAAVVAAAATNRGELAGGPADVVVPRDSAGAIAGRGSGRGWRRRRGRSRGAGEETATLAACG